MLAEKRILIVLPGLELGGAERQALLLARHLAHQEEAQVQVWGLNFPGHVVDICEAERIPTRLVRMSWSRDWIMRCKAWARFTMALRQARPDIILPYSVRPNVLCGTIWRMTGAQLCIWNQRDEGLNDRVDRRFQRWAVRQVPRFVSNSRRGKEFLIHTLGVIPDKVHVINNGVELALPEANRATWRNRLNVSEDCFLVCMVANLHHNKDHATLLHAWRIVLDELKEINYSAHLLLAGQHGNTYESLVRITSELALDRNVHFLGIVKDITGLLKASDVAVFSSRSEGVPNGALESMAAGLAVVGTDIPGIREAVGPSNYAFLAPPGNAAVLADRIIELARNAQQRERIGALNKLRIEQEFSPQQMVNAMTSLIAQGLESTKRTVPHYRKDLKRPDERMACADNCFGLSRSRS